MEWEHFMPHLIHDVRALVRKGLSSAQLLERRLGSDADPEVRGWLDSVISSQRDLNLFMTRIGILANADKHQSQEEFVDLNAAFLGLRLRYRDELAQVGGDLQVDALPDRAVPVGLETAWTELLANSIRFRDPDRSLRVCVSAGEEKGTLWIQFEDNSSGWDPAFSEKLFQPFQRLDARRSGFGLGLAIARTTVDSLGGRIQAELGSPGVRFRVTMPLPAQSQVGG